MTILIKKELTLTEDSISFIEKYIKYIHDVNPSDLYEGKSNKQIIKNKFIYQIYQLYNLDLANIKLDITKEKVLVITRLWNSDPTVIGSMPIDQELKDSLSQGSYPTLRITGGNYKRVVADKYGKDQVRDYFEPYGIILELHEVEDTTYQSSKIDKFYSKTFKTEHSLITFAKVLMCCFAIFGLIMGLGFMFLGFFLTGLMVIIAFFGVNSYTLLLADSYNQKQTD